MTIKKSSGYCAPVAYASAYVSLDEFSREEIETHLRHLNGGDMLPDGSEGEFSFSGDEMGRISTLLLCGQADAARESGCARIGNALGRKFPHSPVKAVEAA